jgi:hypothetical protein
MRRIWLSAFLLVLCGSSVSAAMPAELMGPSPELRPIRGVSNFLPQRLWLNAADDRVMGFDGRVLPEWPIAEGEYPRKLTFVQLVCGAQPDEEHQQDRDPHLPDRHRAEPIEMPEDFVREPERKFEPSFIASDLCGVIVFAAGVVGWIVLGVGVVIVERKP